MTSSKRATNLFLNMIYHDHGVYHYGGTVSGIVGMMGSGKSTLFQQISQWARYIPDASKDSLINRLLSGRTSKIRTEPETVIYRGRQYDHFSCLFPNNWMKSYPNYPYEPKPVNIYIHENDDLVFCYKGSDGKDYEIPHIPSVKTYGNAYDLCQKMDRGAINIVYEPTKYRIPEVLIEYLEQKSMERKMRDMPVKPAVFWYELARVLLMEKADADYYTIMIDEFHQVCPSDSQKDYWHLAAMFQEALLDFRKSNVSFFGSTHDTELVDYRIVHRIIWFIWLKGSTPSKRSRVYAEAIAKLKKGEGWIEQIRGEYDRFEFNRIPGQPPLVHCIDINANKVRLEELPDEMAFA